MKVELDIRNKKNTEKLLAKAIAEIVRGRIEELPRHLRVKAYDNLIEKINIK